MPKTQGEALVAYAEELGLEPQNLDLVIHDCAQEVALPDLNSLESDREQESHIDAQEEQAAALNNGGLASQIEYLLQHHSCPQVQGILRALADEEPC